MQTDRATTKASCRRGSFERCLIASTPGSRPLDFLKTLFKYDGAVPRRPHDVVVADAGARISDASTSQRLRGVATWRGYVATHALAAVPQVMAQDPERRAHKPSCERRGEKRRVAFLT